MSNLICTINCTWNARGKVSASMPLGSHGDETKDILQLFSPSVLLLVSQQLGTYEPATGLALTSHLINYVMSGQNLILPINNALKGARLDFIKRPQGGIAIQLKPETSWLAKGENIEDGSRQFVYNYTIFVLEKLPYYNLIICKIFLGISLQKYLDFLQSQIDLGKLNSSNLNWNTDLLVYMVYVAIDNSIAYRIGTPEAYNKQAETNTLELYAELSEKHKKICKILELD